MNKSQTIDTSKIAKGDRIYYTDLRAGHINVGATVCDVDDNSMQVKFDRRDYYTVIHFADSRWISRIKIVTH